MPKTKTPENEVTRWSVTVDELAGRLAAAEAEVARMSTRRRTLVLPAQTGDAEAAAELARQDAELDQAQRQVRDLGQALEDAKTELADAQERAAEACRVKNHALAAELEREAAAEAAKVDKAMVAIKAAADRALEWLKQAGELRGDRSLPPIVSLLRSFAWNGALAFHKIVGLHHCNKVFIRPFVEGVCGAPVAPADDDQDNRAA
jgi:hypothetical protein